MYVPRAFAEPDVERLLATVRSHAFATLVTAGDGGPCASHAPLLLDAGRGPLGTLSGHLARANPHWREFDGRTPGLAIFHGPHAYVSPRWYASAPNVPTWNYVAVHAAGVPRVIEDRGAVRALLERTAAVFEAGGAEPWSPAGLPEPYRAGMERGIVAFELPIERLEGKRKLSQNKDAGDRAAVIAALRAAGDPAGLAVAREMEALG